MFLSACAARKIAADIWHARGRALLAITAMAIGVFAVVGVAVPDVILDRELARSFAAISPASATITVDPVSPAVLDSAARVSGVGAVDGGGMISARVLTEDAWKPMLIFSAADFGRMRVNRITHETGAWPPPANGILLERSAVRVAGVHPGDRLAIRVGRGPTIPLTFAGTVHDFSQAPAWQEGAVYGYVSTETMATLSGRPGVTVIRIVVRERGDDVAHIRDVAARVAATVSRMTRVRDIVIPTPNAHPHQGQMDALLGIKQAFAIVALLLSTTLVVVLLGAMLVHQRRQIGSMKAIGATQGTIAGMYLLWILALTLCAEAIAIPAGIVAGRAYARFISGLLNFDVTDESIPARYLLLFALVGIGVPVAASLLPIIRAARATTRSALSDVATIPARSRTAPSMLHGSPLGRLLSLAIASSARARGRFALTVTALGVGGALFLAALDLGRSFNVTLDTNSTRAGYDIIAAIAGETPRAEVVALLRAVPGVAGISTATVTKATAARSHDDPTAFSLTGLPMPARSGMGAPLGGRRLRAGDSNVVVANQAWARAHPEYAVGDSIDIVIGGSPSRWLLAGIVREVMTGPTLYASDASVASAAAIGPHATVAQISASAHDPESVAFLRATIEQRAQQAGMRVTTLITMQDIVASREAHQLVIVTALLVMAGLSLVVGALGLASTLSVGIFERSHELGVMRAIGASRRQLLVLVLAEGIFIATVAYAGSLLLSIPATYVLDDVFGNMMLGTGLDVAFSGGAVAALAGVSLIVAIVASALPALRAAALEPRQLLAAA